MLKMFNARTNELDDPKIAVKEIFEQLNLSKNLLKNSAAIITVYQDADEKVVKAVADSLPFDSIGMTTFMSATEKQFDYMQISVSVFTSDDVEIAVGCSDEIIAGSDKEFSAPLKATLAKIKNPQVILGTTPLLQYASVDYYTRLVSKIDPKLSLFSLIAIDNTLDYHLSRTIFNGEKFVNRFPFIVLGGEKALNFDFAIATISPEKAFTGHDESIVTKSVASLVIEVNGEPIGKYLSDIGFIKDKDENFSWLNANPSLSNPFLVDFQDGTLPEIRAIFAFTADGTAIIGGDIPVGSKISIGQFDADEIVSTTKKVLTEFVEKNKNANGFILYSCCGRYYNLGFDSTEEVEVVQEIIAKTGKPFLFSYSGGEMCPVYNNENVKINRGHNYTCIMVAF